MALDKLVDSTQLNTDLTAVANAIRTKGGTSAELEFPSGFVSAVEAIPSGGGSTLPPIISKIDGGSFTPASDEATSLYAISHNLGVAPTDVVIWATDITKEAYNERALNMLQMSSDYYQLLQVNTNGGDRQICGITPSGDLGASSFKLSIGSNVYKANVTYKWLAWA